METIIYAINEIREEAEFVNANSPTIEDADPTAIIAIGVVIGLAVIALLGFIILSKNFGGKAQ